MPQTYPLREKSFIFYTSINGVKENSNDYNLSQNEMAQRTKLLKRIPLEKLMDLKIDYAFKQFFGSEKNKKITVVFLNAILERTGRNQIKDISFKNTEVVGEYEDDKQSRLDLLVVTDADEWINVEIQFTNKFDMIKRSIYYWSEIYRAPLQTGMTYKELKPVIAINIMNFNLFDQTERFHTTYRLYENEEKFELTNVMEFHFLEMPKLIKKWKDDKLDPWNDVLARWLLVLGMVDRRKNKIYEDIYHELEDIAMKDETLRSAFQYWEELSMSHEQYLAYESRLKQVLDDEAFQREKELHEEKMKRHEEDMKQYREEKKRHEEDMKRHKEDMKRHKEEKRRHAEKMKQRESEVKQKEKRIEQKRIELEKNINNEELKANETVAYKLLSKGMDIEFIKETTGLTEEKIIEIKRNIQK